jgi:anti-sigma B factor antagonist
VEAYPHHLRRSDRAERDALGCLNHMELQINQRSKEGITILDLQGQLMIGESEALFREFVTQLAKAGTANVILNLLDVTEIDSDGLSALDLCGAMIRGAGGAMRFVNLGKVRFTSAELTELYATFEVYDDEQEAVNSFFPTRTIRRLNILQYLADQKRQGE